MGFSSFAPLCIRNPAVSIGGAGLATHVQTMKLSYAEPVTGSQRRISPGLVVLIGALAVSGLAAGGFAGQYHRLVRLDQAVQREWAQLERAYQRRVDLAPALLASVKGAASFERDTLSAVTLARAGLEDAPTGRAPSPVELEEFQRSQDALGIALSRLMVVVEAYPELRATSGFRDLQSQVEGSENRIAAGRLRFNLAVQEFNSVRDAFPTSLVAALFGARFTEKAAFRTGPGAPERKFEF
jgi:LemA protein